MNTIPVVQNPAPIQPMSAASHKHSGFGIASFIIAVTAILFSGMLIIAAGVIEASMPGGVDSDSIMALLLGFLILAAAGFNLLGLAFGIVGVFQKERKKIFGILGTIISSITFIGFLGLIIMGIVSG